ncbi:hypothetical protein ES703_10230 [subsurface metagenome]
MLSEKEVRDYLITIEDAMRIADARRNVCLREHKFNEMDQYDREFWNLVGQIKVIRHILEEDY